MGLVACAVFKTVGRCLWRLWWVRFPHAPANPRSADRLTQRDADVQWYRILVQSLGCEPCQ